MSPTDSPAQPPTDVGALARELDRVARRVEEYVATGERVGELETGLREVWGLINSVMDRLNGTTPQGEKPPPKAWLLISDPEQAVAVLTDLVEWLDAVYLRFPGSELPACWMWHPWVIQELLWLRTSFAEADAAKLSGVPAGMWHDQQRPRVVDRIRQHIGSCDLKEHSAAGQKARPPAAAPLAGHVQALAEAWTSRGLPPEPTPEQLEDARAYRELKLRRSSPST